MIQDIILFNNSFIHITFYTLLFIFLSTLSYANDDKVYGKGAYYFSQGDYKNAFKIWLPLAQKGNPAAQYSVALLYDQGHGVTKNKAETLKYLQLAVNQDLPDAQYYLAMKYYYGLSIKKDYSKTRELLIKAAKQDNLKAQFQLANLYNKGEGGKEDQEQATYWFTTAAENNYGPAQHSLAARFLTGKGTSSNIDKGVFWLKKAVVQNDSDAQRDLGFMYYKGIGVDKNYQKANELLRVPAKEDSPMAIYLLGDIYAQGGYGITQDIKQAKKFYQKAQKLGYKQADKAIQKLSQQPIVHQTKVHKSVTHKTPIINQAPIHKKTLNKKSYSPTSVAVTPKKSLDNRSAKANYLNSNIQGNARYFQKINDNYYTLQVSSSNNYPNLLTLIEKYYDENTYLLEISKNKKHSYLLSYGLYENYSDAKQAIQFLPKAFQLSSKPQISTVKTIKALQIIQQKPSLKDVQTNNNMSAFQQSNNNDYTLQLLSSKKYSSITELTDKFSDQYTYILATPNNKNTSYILTYGLYNNYSQAKQAVKSLPHIFQLPSKPWIRKVKNIKKLMTQN